MTTETPTKFLRENWQIIMFIIGAIATWTLFGSDLKRAQADIKDLESNKTVNDDRVHNLETNVYILCKSSPQKLPCIEPTSK